MKKVTIILLILLILLGCNNSASTKPENVRDEFYDLGIIMIEATDLMITLIYYEVTGDEFNSHWADLNHKFEEIMSIHDEIWNVFFPEVTEEEKEIFVQVNILIEHILRSSFQYLLEERNNLAVLLRRPQR